MLRLLWTLLGLALLVAAAALLWMARGPLPQNDLTTGGVLYTQPELAAEGGAGAMGAVVDAQGGQVAIAPAQPEFSSGAQADLAAVDPGELSAATTADVGAAGLTAQTPLTTDIVIGDQTAIAIAPLAQQAEVADGQGGLAPSAAGYEQRVVELEWPDHLPVGRAGSVRVKLKMLESGALQPVAEIGDNEVVATPILITDRYDTHVALVTATLSAPDFSVESVNIPTQPLARGGEAEWRWTIRADDAQTSVIALGLAISWEPQVAGAQPITNVPIWGQAVQVQVDYVFGLITVPQATIAGTALAVLGFIAEVPLLGRFLELLLGALFRPRRRRRARRTDNRDTRRR